MGLLDKFIDKEKTEKLTVKDPRAIVNSILKGTSGSSLVRDLKYNIFYQIYCFKGVVDGVGVSTLVANTALAMADLGISVLVIDTSILQPVQDVLLKTNVENKNEKNLYDWFDLPYIRNSVLHSSSLNNRVSVLSFYGKHRGMIDVLSTNDSGSLVDLALTEFHNKFDIILIDSCHELTSINMAAMQMSQQIIQVWNDTPTVVSNIDDFITNCVTLSCPLDKMRNVVFSKLNRDAMGNLDVLVKEYRLKKLATCYLSESCSLVLVTGKPLWQYVSSNKDIIEYTNFIIDVISLILNIDTLGSKKARGTITSNDIVEGKVDGTLSKEIMEDSHNNEAEDGDTEC